MTDPSEGKKIMDTTRCSDAEPASPAQPGCGTEEALAAAEELLADDNAPVLSNGEHSWLKHNIARLCDFFAADRVAAQTLMLSDDQVVASLVLEYGNANEAAAGRYKTEIAALRAVIDSYQREAKP